MWLDDAKVRDLISGWRDTAKDCVPEDSYAEAMEDAADRLEQLIEEQQKMLPPPSEGSERCMIYTKGPR